MIFLREITREDLDKINQYRNDRSLVDSLAAPFRHINRETDQAWFETYMKTRSNQVRCAVCLRETSEMVGLASLTGIDWVHRSGEFHIILADPVRHQGIGTTATREMLRHAFEDLNLNRVHLSVLTSNEAALRLYEKAGFKKEGTLRQSVYKNGRYQDMILMSMIREEYPPPE